MLESLEKEYEQSTKSSMPVALAMPPPLPPPPIVIIPSGDPVREAKLGNSKGRAKREHLNDKGSDFEQSALSRKIVRAIKKFQKKSLG